MLCYLYAGRICVRSSLYCSNTALAPSGSALPSSRARCSNIWVWKAAPLAQCLRDLRDNKNEFIPITLVSRLLSHQILSLLSLSHLESQSPPSRQVFSCVRMRLNWASSLMESWISLPLSLRLILQRFRYSSITSWSSWILCITITERHGVFLSVRLQAEQDSLAAEHRSKTSVNIGRIMFYK